MMLGQHSDFYVFFFYFQVITRWQTVKAANDKDVSATSDINGIFKESRIGSRNDVRRQRIRDREDQHDVPRGV